MLNKSEYNPYFQTYVSKYASQNKSIIEGLQLSNNELFGLIKELPEEKETYRYEEGKWTLKELLLHCIDTERIFNYRALRIARNDRNDLLGFDQDEFNEYANANDRTLASLVDEFNALRNSTIALFDSFEQEALMRIGKASGNPISVRAIGYIISGHLQHHLNMFRERYL